MCRLLAFWVAVLVWGWSLSLSPVQARGAIYASSGGDTGWCTGRRSQADARNCAHEQCMKQASGDCELVLDCKIGWAAIAYGPKTGYGILCEITDKDHARIGALFACILAVKDKCYTADAFPERGSVLDKQDNKTFDDIFYAQVMLKQLGYYGGTFNGLMGAATEAALIKYQQETKGLPVSGKVDDATTASLSAGVGGISVIIDLIAKGTDGALNPTLSMKSWAGNQTAQGEPQKPAIQQGGNPFQTTDQNQKQSAQQGEQNQQQVPNQEARQTTAETFGVADGELDAHFAAAFTQLGNYSTPVPATCGKASANEPYVCTTSATEGASQTPTSLALALFASSATPNEDALARGLASGSAYEGQLYRTTNGYSFQRKGAPQEQKFDGICYQTLGAKNSPVACFLYLTPRVALVVTSPPSQPSTKQVNVEGGKSLSPETDSAKSLLLTGLATFGSVELPK